MSKVGQKERATQNRVVRFFTEQLGYKYFGNWEHRDNNRNIDTATLKQWLMLRGVSDTLITRVLRKLEIAASLGEGKKLFDANKEVYRLLRYGVTDKEGAGEQNQTVWLIDWQHPQNNHFAIAEEVTVVGANNKRPDIVLYVNGIALGVIELKRASVSVSDAIKQNIESQKKEFIPHFFTTMQLVMAGNDTQGIRYGTLGTKEKYFLTWKEPQGANALPLPHIQTDSVLDIHLAQLCDKARFLDIIHDFIVFDAGIKKTCRHNQFFGVQAAKKHIENRQDGIIWHTQGSGKSLTMVWLAKWIREHVKDARVLIVTDRKELDQQIEKVFTGVDESIFRATSGAELIRTLHHPNPWLVCSLVQKFGRHGDGLTEKEDEEATSAYIDELKKSLSRNFSPKGNLFVFVDECHRTQSGKLHAAMTEILPKAMFIGFTGTPLMKADKKKSLEVFGPYIHTYKFNEAVSDGVVLDLRYEARDIDQHLTSQKKVDLWFEAKTRNISHLAKSRLKQKWGTMQKVLSSKSRLEQIVNDILMDMETKAPLINGRGNAMLVCASVHQACVIYELFSDTDFADKCAIVTSYKPLISSIKNEDSGEGQTEKLFKYHTYRKMLAEYFEQSEDEAVKRLDEFERSVKTRFQEEPGKMRLLIVVDKLLTGFDAPSATYLYIDKSMHDHSLFQAICRVNRLDGDEKEYGYIVDYKDLFTSLDKTIKDYTTEAFDGYDREDVAGLLKDRLVEAKSDITNALEAVRALCEPVKAPRDTINFQHYFCGESGVDSLDSDQRSEKEMLRLALYHAAAKLLRAYANIANEMEQAGYSKEQADNIRQEVIFYEQVRNEVKVASGDALEMKLYEPAMRRLLDMYIRADDSTQLIDFEELGLIDLIVNNHGEGLNSNSIPKNLRDNEDAMAEAIENNVRKTIIDENPVNPRYFDQMSSLLDELIVQRREKAINYQTYLEKVRELTKKVVNPTTNNQSNYPNTINTKAKQALYDNLGQDEVLATNIDTTMFNTKKADWLGDHFKEKEIKKAISEKIADYALNIDDVMDLLRKQKEYH
ncbi:type I restriction endonuclease subunit R [Marinomonas transparens]|uniref:Type I restriction enzyme endonuclease subunit n=1 Tax=Marinomonas transparens TaxID=2795388 RepID=A0A934JUL3_9GAMM|nr:HsdR family type I site-specific deoxyribonuclease [Marinomonas transparens]MBJ7538626.1 HsdR family type I site-specific deoxyribonuclease [Marinomonas transparens]